MIFHDYSLRVLPNGKEVYSLTGLPEGSKCLVYPSGDRWERLTRNHGSSASKRYVRYLTLDEALAAGIAWARRKDAEASSAA